MQLNADLLVWILKHNYGINLLLHYLDDFHTLGPPNSPVCQNNVNACVQLFLKWSIPLHPDKLEGPSKCLTVLGTELDSMTLQARLPQDKFDRIAALLESWSLKQHCMEFCSDNMAVVSVLCSGTSKDPNMMVLLRSLSLSAACYSFAFTASHRAGRDNCTAGALSPFDFQRFCHLAPHAAPAATPISPSLLAQLPVI